MGSRLERHKRERHGQAKESRRAREFCNSVHAHLPAILPLPEIHEFKQVKKSMQGYTPAKAALRTLLLQDASRATAVARAGPSRAQTKNSAHRQWPNWPREPFARPTSRRSRFPASLPTSEQRAARLFRILASRPSLCRNQFPTRRPPPSTSLAADRLRDHRIRRATSAAESGAR